VYVRVCFVVPGFGTELVTDCGTLSFISSTHSLGKKPTCEEQRRFEKLLRSLETDMPRLHHITLRSALSHNQKIACHQNTKYYSINVIIILETNYKAKRRRMVNSDKW